MINKYDIVITIIELDQLNYKINNLVLLLYYYRWSNAGVVSINDAQNIKYV